MHRKCSVTEPPFLHLSWPKPLLFVCSLFFFSRSQGCLIVAIKKCVMPLLEPLDESPAKTELFKEVDVSGGGKGCCHSSLSKFPYFPFFYFTMYTGVVFPTKPILISTQKDVLPAHHNRSTRLQLYGFKYLLIVLWIQPFAKIYGFHIFTQLYGSKYLHEVQ